MAAGAQTDEHLHTAAEEIYHFSSGAGRMRLGEREFAVEAGDTVVIAAGMPHKLWADAGVPLVVICACSPPYSDADTILTGD